MVPETLWTPEQVADHYGVPLATIYRWRVIGYGPSGYKVGRHVRYPASAVERWDREQQAAALAGAR